MDFEMPSWNFGQRSTPSLLSVNQGQKSLLYSKTNRSSSQGRLDPSSSCWFSFPCSERGLERAFAPPLLPPNPPLSIYPETAGNEPVPKDPNIVFLTFQAILCDILSHFSFRYCLCVQSSRNELSCLSVRSVLGMF